MSLLEEADDAHKALALQNKNTRRARLLVKAMRSELVGVLADVEPIEDVKAATLNKLIVAIDTCDVVVFRYLPSVDDQ